MTAQAASAGEGPAIIGPVQAMVVGFEAPNFTGEVLPELRRLQDAGIIRLVDLLVVEKNEAGDLKTVELSGLTDEERVEFGAVAGALVGWGLAGSAEGLEEGSMAGALAMADGAFSEADIWSIEESVPPGSAAAIAIIEHVWAIPFRDAVVRAGGVAMADEWLHPLDLIAAGVKVAEASTA